MRRKNIILILITYIRTFSANCTEICVKYIKWKPVNSEESSSVKKQFTLNVQVIPVVRTPEIASPVVILGEFNRPLVSFEP
jgi:hypothetical protein